MSSTWRCRFRRIRLLTKGRDAQVRDLRAEIPDEDIIVRAHEELVGCIIDNLLGNATKYTDSGSVTLSLSRQGRNVRIVVADTGRGISKDMQKRMYKPHVRDHAALDKDGSGWGLYEVKCAVKKYGGRIQCRSELGKGTEFSVTLPHGRLRGCDLPTAGRHNRKSAFCL